MPQGRGTINNSEPISNKANPNISRDSEGGNINFDILPSVQPEETLPDPIPPEYSTINNSSAITDKVYFDAVQDVESDNVNTDTRSPVETQGTLSEEITDCDASADDTKDETDMDEIFSDPNPAKRPSRISIFKNSRENIVSQRDNIVVFVNSSGQPCDIGARAYSRKWKTLS